MGNPFRFRALVHTAGKGDPLPDLPLEVNRGFRPLTLGRDWRTLHGDARFVFQVLQVGACAGLRQASFGLQQTDDVFALHRGRFAVRVGFGKHGAGFGGLGDHGNFGDRSGVDDDFFVQVSFGHDNLSFSG